MRKGKIADVFDHGCGLIRSDWEQVFFDQSAVERGQFRLLRPGDEVEYETVSDHGPGSAGPQAYMVRRVPKGALCAASEG